MKNHRLWSKKIVEVLLYYLKDENNFLFAITGDIDNLGIFVANNGRPLAENLVDVYNHLIGIFLYDFVANNPEIKIFHLIPSGEELFAIGICENKEVIKKFFGHIELNINPWIKGNVPKIIFDDSITVSFGSAIVQKEVNIKEIKKLSNFIDSEDDSLATEIYLSIMLKIREVLAYDLDVSKFRNLDAQKSDIVIYLRNTIYRHMLKYKEETKEDLIQIAEKCRNKTKLRNMQEHLLNRRYGLLNK